MLASILAACNPSEDAPGGLDAGEQDIVDAGHASDTGGATGTDARAPMDGGAPIETDSGSPFEICDGVDNDGDDEIDEGLAGMGPGCPILGVCAGGADAICEGGMWECRFSSAYYEDDEVRCDGLDNDCDGTVDEDSSCCRPMDCAAQSADCGRVADGCGAFIECGPCTAPQVCGGAGADNRCGCPSESLETQGPNTPGRSASNATIAGPAWSFEGVNPLATIDADDSLAGLWIGTAHVRLRPGTPTSQYLIADDFGFSIPTDAQIRGVTVEIRRRTVEERVADHRVRILKGGLVGSGERQIGSRWVATYAHHAYGGAVDTWGEEWTAADINDTGFGVALSTKMTQSAGNADALVDHVQITVHYAQGCI